MHSMEKRDFALLRIGEIADSEALGSRLFLTHTGLIALGAVGALVVMNQGFLAVLMFIYIGLFTLEKFGAGTALRYNRADALNWVRGLLFARALAYNAIIIYVWTLEGSIYHMVAMALIVASTINIFVHNPSNIINMSCVVLPNWLAFAVISGLIYIQYGLSPEFLGSLLVIFCITPYFLISLMKLQGTLEELSTAKRDLMRSRRLDGMGKVAGGVSHDFNNILSVVSGSLQLLENTTDKLERQELFDVATKAIAHGASLNRQLIALGKKSPLLPRSITLTSAVQEFTKFAERVLPENIKISITQFDPQLKVLVDPGMLQSAMLNIALNAKAAMPDGGKIKIGVRLAAASEIGDFTKSNRKNGGEYAILSMEDTGTGMSPELREQAFEPFFTTREVGGGSGLGLPMVKGFVEQSNGALKLTSRLGFGTCVEMFLPITTRPLQMVADQDNETLTSSELPEFKPRILVVEDNPQLLQIISLKLIKDGFEVVACASGDQAVQVLDSELPFDAVLSDVVMPGEVQGGDLLGAVKAYDPDIRECPIFCV